MKNITTKRISKINKRKQKKINKKTGKSILSQIRGATMSIVSAQTDLFYPENTSSKIPSIHEELEIMKYYCSKYKIDFDTTSIGYDKPQILVLIYEKLNTILNRDFITTNEIKHLFNILSEKYSLITKEMLDNIIDNELSSIFKKDSK